MRRDLSVLMQDLAQRQGLLTGGLFVLATVYTLYFAKALLMPIFLAVLVALVLRPVVRLLRRLYLPEALAAGLVILAIIMLLGWVILAIAEPASAWIDRGPLLRYQLEYKFETLLAPFEKVQEATKNIQDAASLGEDAKDTVVVEGPSLLHQLFLEVQSAFVNIMVIFVLVFFLLARGGWTYRRVSAAIEDDETREMWTDVLDDIRTNLAHYLLTISAINAGLGVLTAIAMQILGMPNALLWGVLAAVLNFIPYAGSLVTLAIITAVSVLTFDQWLTIMLPPLAFLFLTFLEGQLISPFVVGRRLTLDPIAVFISVLFWGWLWGFAGMLLAVPILASLKITIGAIESLAPLSAIIDSQGDEDLPVEV